VKKRRKAEGVGLDPNVHPDAAGIDVGSEELVVAVGYGRSEETVRTFAAMTPGLHEMRDWLVEVGIRTVAMESTGNYWIAAYQILEEAGLEVCLVNARHVKGVPGKKTDVCDAQWLQQLHSAGLLRGSFRPEKEIVPIRYLMRHRSQLVAEGSRELQHMQKVLTEMNVKLHHVFSDLDGESAQRILEAILAGERDGEVLWALRDVRCRASKSVFSAAIQGDWRPEYLFVLAQCHKRYHQTRLAIQECDRQLVCLLANVAVEKDSEDDGPGPSRCRRNKNDVGFDLRREAWRFYSVDLTTINGISMGTLAVLMSELGTGPQIRKAFRSAPAFCSWLGLCPDNRISGGKVLKSKTRAVANRVAAALRLAAQGLGHAHCELGSYCRRMKARLGKAEGITAVAHKLARLIFALITTRKPYNEAIAFAPSPQSVERKIRNLQNQAQRLGLQLVTA
jgi:transposase